MKTVFGGNKPKQWRQMDGGPYGSLGNVVQLKDCAATKMAKNYFRKLISRTSQDTTPCKRVTEEKSL